MGLMQTLKQVYINQHYTVIQRSAIGHRCPLEAVYLAEAKCVFIFFRINTMAIARRNYMPTRSILAGRMSKRQCTTGGGFRFSGGVGPHFRLEIAGNPIDPIGKGVADISEPSQIAGCKGV